MRNLASIEANQGPVVGAVRRIPQPKMGDEVNFLGTKQVFGARDVILMRNSDMIF